MTQSGVHVRVEQVSRHYGGVEAVRQVSLTLQPGEFVALMGPSGCGKSSLLNLIGAIDRPDSGHLWIEETDLSTLDDAGLTRMRRERMGFVFQFFNLLATLTVAENIALPLELTRKLSEKAVQHRVDTLLEQVHLTHRKDFHPSQLSGGEMQRVAIARALAHQPALILADEPTGNLDTETGAQILSLLTRLCRENGQTILMATHSTEAAAVADRTLHMRDGRMQDATP